MQIDFLPDDWSINSVRDRQERINPKPQYQRTPVWNESKNNCLLAQYGGGEQTTIENGQVLCSQCSASEGAT